MTETRTKYTTQSFLVETQHGIAIDESALPPRARASDPVTSKLAAVSLRPGTQMCKLFIAYTEHPEGLTDEQAERLTGIKSAWKRCSDLRRLGLIEQMCDENNKQVFVESSAGQMVMVCIAVKNTGN